MVLRFRARESTRDVDVVILAPGDAQKVRELARRVAEEYGWAEDWLNDGVPLAAAVARLCLGEWYGGNTTASGSWRRFRAARC